MTETIKEIFDENRKLIGLVDQAVYYMRTQEYEHALLIVSDTASSINAVADAVIKNREYFSLVSTDSVAEMIEGIVEAKKKRDYVLLADLFEMQLLNFACSVQELIMQREDYLAFDEMIYEDNIRRLKADTENAIREAGKEGEDTDLSVVNAAAILEEELDPTKLMEEGFFVEYSSCGLMTLAGTDAQKNKFYYHSNNKIGLESFLWALNTAKEKPDMYIVLGFGMGYHIAELAKQAPGCRILVYEPDIRVLKLAAAFSDIGEVLANRNVRVAYDPGLSLIRDSIGRAAEKKVKTVIYEPSVRKYEETGLFEVINAIRNGGKSC